jgi:hypothetical protein
VVARKTGSGRRPAFSGSFALSSLANSHPGESCLPVIRAEVLFIKLQRAELEGRSFDDAVVAIEHFRPVTELRRASDGVGLACRIFDRECRHVPIERFGFLRATGLAEYARQPEKCPDVITELGTIRRVTCLVDR